jgi:hypothetical protein
MYLSPKFGNSERKEAVKVPLKHKKRPVNITTFYQKHIACFGSDHLIHLSGIYRSEIYRQMQLKTL